MGGPANHLFFGGIFHYKPSSDSHWYPHDYGPDHIWFVGEFNAGFLNFSGARRATAAKARGACHVRGPRDPQGPEAKDGANMS